MTWHTLADLAAGVLVSETHMDEIRENIEHLGTMQAGGTALSALAASSELTGIYQAATGTYTGDGTGAASGTSGQAITGVGFQPDVVFICTADKNGLQGALGQAGTGSSNGYIASFDADGFTVSDGGGDSPPNQNGRAFAYLAMKTA